MSPKLANRRYFRLMMGGSAGYVISLMGVTWLTQKSDAITAFNIGLGLIPGLFVVIMLYSIWRYLREVDEAARYFLTKSLMLASFTILAIAGVWGLLEMLIESLPRLPVFWIFPIFFFVLGLQSAIGPNRGTHCG